MATKKMLLVPPETFIGQLDPYTKKLSELDNKMNQIMGRKDLDEFNKALQYQQVLHNYLSVRDKLLQPTPIPLVEKELQTKSQIPAVAAADQVTTPPEEDFRKEVIKSVPKSLHSKADRLIDVLHKTPGLSWNHRGEMVLQGNVYAGSNYVDLINDVLRSRKTIEPVGWQVLANALNEVNVPQDLVGNAARWKYMRGSTPSTPVGKRLRIPVKRQLTLPPAPPSKRNKQSEKSSTPTKVSLNWSW